MKRYKLFPFFLLLTFLFSNCRATLMKVTGINKVDSYSAAQLKKLTHEYGIDSPVYALSNDYINYAKSFRDSSVLKNLTQPLQIIFFKDKKVQTHLINCTVGGFPDLKWNRYHTIGSLPFASFPVVENDLKIDSILNYIYPAPDLDLNKNICIVFWNNWMGRQSKNLIEYSKNPKIRENYQVLYVNNDNYFSDPGNQN